VLDAVRPLPFRDFEFHGYTGKRRVVSFGWQYDFEARRLRKADDMPAFLVALRETAALAPLVALLLVLGFYPKPALDVINPAVETTLQQVGVSDPAPTEPLTAEEGQP